MFVTRRTFDKFMAALTLPNEEVVASEDVLERLKQKAIPRSISRATAAAAMPTGITGTLAIIEGLAMRTPVLLW